MFRRNRVDREKGRLSPVSRSGTIAEPAAEMGTELGHPTDYRFLLGIAECGFWAEEIAYNNPFFKFLMQLTTPFPFGNMIY